MTLRPLIHLGIMDHPVSRSAHKVPTPKGGGLAIVTAFLAGMALQAALHHVAFGRFQFCFASGIICLCIISWIDDIYSFPARYKLSAQIFSGTIIAVGCSSSLTLLCLMVATALIVTNVINFMDGLNGLAAGVMLTASLFIAGAGILPPLTLLLASSLLGFLPFNFPHAKIFMGDSGSQPCALLLSGLAMTRLAHHAVPLEIDPLFWLFPSLLAGMLWDVFFTLARRCIAHDTLAHAHNGHLYQLAVRTGIPAFWITLLHWGFTIWGGSIFFLLHGPERWGAIIAPQLLWTLTVVSRAHHHLHEKW